MKQTFKSLVALVALVSTAASSAVPYIAARSDSVNAARDMVGWEEFIHLCDMESTYGAFSVTPEYKQTFRPCNITQCLFGIGNCSESCGTTCSNSCSNACSDSCSTSCSDDCGVPLLIQGSQVANRDPNAWLADYFGLPTDFSSSITFRPKVKTWLVDLSFYLGMDELANGLYFRIHAPIVHANWSLNFKETVVAPGTNPYTVGYFNINEVSRNDMNTQAIDFFKGGSESTLTFGTGDTTTTLDGLECSRWSAGSDCSCSGQSKTRLSDIEAALGWNFYCDEDYAVGLSIRASAPTGNKPNDCFLFSPVIGQGGNWKLGGGLDAHAIFWRSENENSSLGLYLEANVQHLFKACQTRCFDLCIDGGAGENSRYMLAEKLTPEGTNTQGLAGSTAQFTGGNAPCPPALVTPGTTATVTPLPTLSTRQFAGEFAPVANLTTSKVNVDAAVEGDVALKLAYTHGGFSFDLGYEFWGRSCERFCKRADCNTTTISDWALKGDAFVYGYTCPVTFATAAGVTGVTPAIGTLSEINAGGIPVALAATESKATILNGTSSYSSGTDNNTNPALNASATGLGTNASADNAQFAFAKVTSTGTVVGEVDIPLLAGGNTQQTRTSIQPIVLDDANVNYATTKGISNKLFAHFSYAWNDREDWMPFLGVGGEVEFGNDGCGSNCDSDCNATCGNSSSSCGTSCGTSCDSSCNTTCGSDCGSARLQGSCKPCGGFSQWGVWAKIGIAFN